MKTPTAISPICLDCGAAITAQDRRATQLDSELCATCWDKAGVMNEHNDGYHEERPQPETCESCKAQADQAHEDTLIKIRLRNRAEVFAEAATLLETDWLQAGNARDAAYNERNEGRRLSQDAESMAPGVMRSAILHAQEALEANLVSAEKRLAELESALRVLKTQAREAQRASDHAAETI